MSYGGGAKCPKCQKTVYFNEEVLAAGKKWHKVCFRCFQCGKSLDSMTMANRGGELYCQACHKKNFANFEMVKEVQPGATSGSLGGGKSCGTCGKPVYFNERVLGAGREFHKQCFKCSDCNKMLESTTVADHEGTIFCKACHKKKFGLKGYGYGQGAGTLAMDGSIESRPPNMPPARDPTPSSGPGDKCGRCGKTVYHAEKAVGAGKVWHKLCFKCANCGKGLDSSTVRDSEGMIYCSACHAKQFGPKGYGFGGGAGTLVNTT